MDLSIGFMIFPSPASPSGGGAVTLSAKKLRYLLVNSIMIQI